MEELESVLRAHAWKYPGTEPADAVKLIYQNEFGGGHLIRDEESCLAYLRREHAETPRGSGCPLWEPIGNGLVRVNLAAVEEKDLQTLGEAFIRSAQAHTGSLPNFLNKLQLLRNLARQGVFSFGVDALDSYLLSYEKLGYPAVSHSAVYRDTYCPAYRVVRREFLPW